MECLWHTCINKADYGRLKKFCSSNCKSKFYVDKRRKKLKSDAVEYLGGKCQRCGWNEHQAGLTFHHKDPSVKEFGISSSGTTKSWDRVKQEIDKCYLLCHNCHSVVHALNDEKFIHS